MRTEIEHVIIANSFEDLTPHDRSLIWEWANSKEEFEGLKMMLLTAPSIADHITLSKQVEDKLMADFRTMHSPKAPLVKFWYQDPKWIGIAAVVILGLISLPFLMTKEKTTLYFDEVTQMADESYEKEKAQSGKESIEKLDPGIEESSDFVAELTSNDNALLSNSPEKPTNVNDLEPKFNEVQVISMESQKSLFSREPSKDATKEHSDILSEDQILGANKQITKERPEILNVLVALF
jgi:hypothetical protein